MTTTNIVTDRLRQQWNEYRKTAERLETELDAVKTKMDAYQHVLADLNRKPQPASGGTGLHATIMPSQLVHCPTQREGWVEIARLSGGFVKPTEGAQLLVDIGLSKKNRRQVASNGASWMSNSDRWERSDKGLYRLLEHDAGGSPNDENKGDDERHEESHQTDSGGASRPSYQDDMAFGVDPAQINA